ncbi:hypothetical protein [Microvirga sesbaniae]|uniref:hypothetical protein n=1 Tax=Microvirga sesbaniae TaxID=681392 RepID=UPI0021CA90DB|nr:hypothetical protein [Microvirga sp. HBU67692]
MSSASFSQGAPHGSPWAYREFIEETLNMARIQAELGVTYASIGDDAGLEYTVRRLVAYTRAALTTLNDLRTTKEQRL